MRPFINEAVDTQMWDIYNVLYAHLSEMFYTIEFRLDEYDGKLVTTATLKRWMKESPFPTKCQRLSPHPRLRRGYYEYCVQKIGDSLPESAVTKFGKVKLFIKESNIQYTDELDCIYDTLKRKYRNDDRFEDISMVKEPRRAVRVTTVKEIGKNGEQFDITRYIYISDKSGRIVMVSEDDKPRVFIDCDAVIDTVTAAIGNIKNQVMQIVKDAFEFFGGSFNPEFLMQSNDKPDVEIKVKANGKNIEIIPMYRHIPDYANIKRGISIYNAPKAIADTAIEAVETYDSLKNIYSYL